MAIREQMWDGKQWLTTGINVKGAPPEEKTVQVIPEYKFTMTGLVSLPVPSIDDTIFYGGEYTMTHTTGTLNFTLTPVTSIQPAQTLTVPDETSVSVLNFDQLGLSLDFGVNGVDLSTATSVSIVSKSTGSVKATLYDNPIIPGRAAMTIPVGTEAEKPVNPKIGMIRISITPDDYRLYFAGFPTGATPNSLEATVNPTILSNPFYGGRYTLAKIALDTFKLTPPVDSKQKAQTITATETSVTNLNFDKLGLHLYWSAAKDLSTLVSATVDSLGLLGEEVA